MATPNSQIILALDVDTLKEAEYFVDKLYPKIELFKIGSQLFTAYGPDAVEMVKKRGGRVFLDLKFHDIPKTVGSAIVSGSSISISPLNLNSDSKVKKVITPSVFMMTVHIKGGQAMLEAAAKSAKEKSEELNIVRPFIVGITSLTSEDKNNNTLENVLKASQLAKDSGLDGVVCSALEAAEVRKEYGADFIIVTPGIRSGNDASDDQKRIATVKQAVEAGSNFLVIGRPILKANDPVAKTKEILGDLYGRRN